MDIKLRQRIIGVAVLIVLLIFCVFMLLQGGKKTQPYIPPINTEPPVSLATLPAPAATPATKPSETKPELKPEAKPVVIPALPSSITTTEKTVKNKNQLPAQSPITPPIQNIPTKVEAAPLSVPVLKPATKLEKPVKVLHEEIEIKKTKNTKTTTELNNKTHAEVQKVSSSLKKGQYVVQVGAFKQSGHIKSLTESLRKQGFVVDYHKINTSQGELTVIMLGGNGIEKERAEHFKAVLEKEYQLKPIIKEVK
jgi:cell division septation protein DedD